MKITNLSLNDIAGGHYTNWDMYEKPVRIQLVNTAHGGYWIKFIYADGLVLNGFRDNPFRVK